MDFGVGVGFGPTFLKNHMNRSAISLARGTAGPAAAKNAW